MLGDSPLGSSPLGALGDAPLLDTLIASDAITGDLCAVPLVDTPSLIDVITGRLTVSSALADEVTALDAIAAHYQATTADTVTASESLSTDLTSALADPVAVTDQITGLLAASSALSDAVTVADLIGYGFVGDAADTVTAADSIAGQVDVYAPILADTVTVAEVLAGPTAVYAPVLADTVGATDAITGVLALVGVLSDTVLAGDALADAAYQVIIVTNVETGAVSTYTMTPTIAGLAEYRGTLYLAGPDGLYAMDAVDDLGDAVAWELRTGFSTLGTDKIKRIQDLNILARTDGETALHVVSSRQGEKQTWSYPQTPLTRGAFRDGIVKVGKGIQSVYYEFGLTGTGPAEIDQLHVTIEPLSRRR